jgi:hypothetical protein
MAFVAVVLEEATEPAVNETLELAIVLKALWRAAFKEALSVTAKEYPERGCIPGSTPGLFALGSRQVVEGVIAPVFPEFGSAGLSVPP